MDALLSPANWGSPIGVGLFLALLGLFFALLGTFIYLVSLADKNKKK